MLFRYTKIDQGCDPEQVDLTAKKQQKMFSILKTRVSDGENISFDVENKLSRTSECCLIPITNKELILGQKFCQGIRSLYSKYPSFLFKEKSNVI